MMGTGAAGVKAAQEFQRAIGQVAAVAAIPQPGARWWIVETMNDVDYAINQLNVEELVVSFIGKMPNDGSILIVAVPPPKLIAGG